MVISKWYVQHDIAIVIKDNKQLNYLWMIKWKSIELV